MNFTHTPTVVRTMKWDPAQTSREVLLNREWLVTNGLGGYASGTVSGAITRRYHGLLIAALPAPLGRMVMWSHVSEFLRFSDDDVVSLGGEERAGGQLDLKGADWLREFRLEDGLPVWTYHIRDLVLEKRVILPHLQNTVHISYRILGGPTRPRLELRPAFHFRHHETPVNEGPTAPYKLAAVEGRYEITSSRGRLPPLRMKLYDCESAFTIAPTNIRQVLSGWNKAAVTPTKAICGVRDFFMSILATTMASRSLARRKNGKLSRCLIPRRRWHRNAERRARP